MDAAAFEEVLRGLRVLNDLREAGPGVADEEWEELERLFNESFEADHHLAAYGTLVPGGENHAVVEGIAGRWVGGLHVHGDLHENGWGAAAGLPAFRSRPDGPRVPVRLLVSKELPAHWKRLDQFEGEQYRRILIPVLRGQELVTVANLYEARPAEED
jgi:gamma-glutamylcyclotransferase (GGCT)/AIG2-like uncharacterized protein YtfP